MKNHFFIAYQGNKREEVELIYNNLDLENTKYIVEPFCGSSALSFYISSKHPKQFTYILNDTNNLLIELYEIFRNEEKLNTLYNEILNECYDENGDFMSKEKYKIHSKNKFNNVLSYFISHKFYSITPGLYPLINKQHKKENFIKVFFNYPIINFLQTENIIFSSIDGVDIFNKYINNKEAIIFIDPPYIFSENSIYKKNKDEQNIYELLISNSKQYINEDKTLLLLCIEKTIFTDVLFKDYESFYYDKKYQNKHRRTEHIVFHN